MRVCIYCISIVSKNFFDPPENITLALFAELEPHHYM